MGIDKMGKDVDLKKSDENVPAKRTSRWAVYSLIIAVAAIISIILFFPATSIYIKHRSFEGFFVLTAMLFSHLAFLLGIVALVIIAFSRNKLRGDWYALLAIFLSIPFILATLSAIYVTRGRAEQIKITHGEQIGEALVRYAKDHNDYLPDANKWCDLLIEHHKKLPKDRFEYDPEKHRFRYDSSKEGVCNYAFNRNLSGLRLDDIPYNIVLIFESKGQWNLIGTEELFEKTSQKRQYVYVYTKDAETGHDSPRAINVKDADYKRVLWEPTHRK